MESSVAVETAKHALLVFGYVWVVGIFCGILANKLKIPDVAIFLLVGMGLGPSQLNLVDIPMDSALNQGILIFGSCYILFDGGASLRLKVLKEVWITITVISTFGVIITAFITAVAAYFILGVPFIVALLLGATIASTDPATLIPVFRTVPIKDRVAQTVMSESAFNDAMGAIITFAILGIAMGTGSFHFTEALGDLFKQTFVGIFVGVGIGLVTAILISGRWYGFLAEYASVVSLMSVIGSYMLADKFEGSGFMAVFVFGIMIGNKDVFGLKMDPVEGEKMEHYVLTTAMVMRMFIFILLGAQVDFALMNTYLVGGVIVVLIFMLVARPATVFACAKLDKRANWSQNEMLFMCWTRETGVIPGALAGMLVGMKAPGAPIIASITFIAILMTILIQATTTAWVARKLDLLVEKD
ncbi:MAG: sodium:proton antiporter, partial [Magnetococcales bacterium]|nr:sodium:proton antiporter [Magnetococcales bacterium]